MNPLAKILTVLIPAAAVSSCAYKGEDHMMNNKIEWGGVTGRSYSAPNKIESEDFDTFFLPPCTKSIYLK